MFIFIVGRCHDEIQLRIHLRTLFCRISNSLRHFSPARAQKVITFYNYKLTETFVVKLNAYIYLYTSLDMGYELL